MSSSGADEPVVLGAGDDDTLLADFTAAVAAGRAVAVVDASWPPAVRRQAVEDVRSATLAPGDLVLFTSGSTGRPRAVVRSLGSWQASLDPLTELTGLTGADVVHLPGPLASSLSLYGAWHARTLGARVVTAAGDPAAATAVHVVPAGLARLLTTPARLPRLRVVVVAGDRLDPRLAAAAHRRGWAVVEYYGATELSFVGARTGAGPLRPFGAAQVQVREDVLWVSSPYLARGYLQGGGPLRREGDWASVGDLARAVPGGFEVLGRGTDAVTTGGHTVMVADVEAVLRSAADVQDCVVVGAPDDRLGEVVAAVVVGTATRGDLSGLVRALPAPARPRRWYGVPAVPLTAAGKPDRVAIRSAVADAVAAAAAAAAATTEAVDTAGAGGPTTTAGPGHALVLTRLR